MLVFDVALDGGQSITTKVKHGPLEGMTVEIDPRVQADMLTGRYETNMQEAIASELSDGDTAFDIGSNFGYFGMVMATAVGAHGHVVCVEPDPTVMEGLRRNVERNSDRLAADVQSLQAAVGAAPGRLRFVRGRHMSRGKLGEQGDIEVDVTTLDEVAARFGAPRLVKIDVEGSEIDVLAGAPKLVGERSAIFAIETHSDDLRRGCIEVLRTAGYTVKEMAEPGRAEAYVVARP
jgi:FkbM family methyltransferase